MPHLSFHVIASRKATKQSRKTSTLNHICKLTKLSLPSFLRRRESKKEKPKILKCKNFILCARSEIARRSNLEYLFQFLFVSLSLKGLATTFLEQARKRQRTCHAVVSSLLGCPCIFVLLRALRDSVVVVYKTTTSNKSSRFIIAKSKILRRHKCVGLKIDILLHCHDTSCLAIIEKMDSRLRWNDKKNEE
jgi:hypothetical protein